jgi:hypothetical protein
MDPIAARTAFLGNPGLFAMQNLLIYALSHTVVLNGTPIDVRLAAIEGYEAYRFHGTPVEVYGVKECAADAAGAFKAYICPYRDLELHQVTLSSAGVAMFTARMDGCSFGIGMPSPQGDITVAHVNRNDLQVSATDTAAMEQQQATELRDAVGDGVKVFGPSQYRRKPGEEEALASFTFGVRDPVAGSWAFFAQVAQGGGMSPWTLRAVKRIG